MDLRGWTLVQMSHFQIMLGWRLAWTWMQNQSTKNYVAMVSALRIRMGMGNKFQDFRVNSRYIWILISPIIIRVTVTLEGVCLVKSQERWVQGRHHKVSGDKIFACLDVNPLRIILIERGFKVVRIWMFKIDLRKEERWIPLGSIRKSIPTHPIHLKAQKPSNSGPWTLGRSKSKTLRRR